MTRWACYAVCAVFGAGLVACSRTTFHAASDGAPARDASVELREPGPEAGPEAGAEAGPEAGAEAGPEAGAETGPEAGPEVALEVGGETGPVVRPACVPAAREPSILVSMGGSSLSGNLAVYGDRLSFAVEIPGPTGTLTGGALVSVSMSTGERATFTIGGNIPAGLIAQPDALFYAQGKMLAIDPSAWMFDYAHVASLDLHTGKVSELDNPPEFSSPSVTSLVGNRKGEIFWVTIDAHGSAGIVRWDPSTRAATTLLKGRLGRMLADEESLYWLELDSSDHVLFRSMPMAGGPVVELYQATVPLDEAPGLEAVDDQRLYYSTYIDKGAGIMAMPKSGGAGVTVVPNVRSSVSISQAIDDTHIYWVDDSAQDVLRRTLKTDSSKSETIWRSPGRWVTDVLVDACNVYWLASNPFELMVRAK